MSRDRKTVALLVETSNEYARGLLHGIVDYVREHRPWSTYLAEHDRGATPPTWLSNWSGDGIIARIENPRIARMIRASGLPTVDLSAAALMPDVPVVETNNVVISKLAFEHLRERGFKNFAYCGDDQYNWSKWRGDHFQACVRQAGRQAFMTSSNVGHRTNDGWGDQMAKLALWIKELPKPVGIMACFDIVGRQVLEACRMANAAVPDEVAVIGVDNDELLCELADPPLSSVEPNTHQTGYLAASLLDKMMSGEKVRPGEHLIVPLGVKFRESTDVLAIEDPDVSQAIRYIRNHACDAINVSDVMAGAPLSRRKLEGRFKKLVGRTPHDEIDRVRLNRVKELLRDTTLSLAEIAHRCGFEHVEYLSVVFKKKEGVPPSVYRQKFATR